MLTFPSIVKVTVTGLRISAVDTVAFLDNCADLIPYAGSGRRIRIRDAAGKYLDGVIGAKGTGETLSVTELVSDGGFTTASNWHTGEPEAWSVNEGTQKAVKISGAISGGYLYGPTSTYLIGALYKGQITVDSISGSGVSIGQHVSVVSSFMSYTATTGAKQGYRTSTISSGAPVIVNQGAIMAGIFDDFSIKQVTAPSTSGLLIRNLAGAQSFQSKESGFTHNAASYVVEVFDMMKVERPIRYMGSSVHHK